MEVDVLGSRLPIDASRIREPPAEIRRQCREYGAGERRSFDLTVDLPAGFTGAALRRVSRIPYGEVRTYGELAADLGSAPVAVGGACARNPAPVVVPCHRVVGADGGLRGYVGGVALKRRLLAREARVAASDGSGVHVTFE